MEDISGEQIIKVNPPKMALFYKIGLGILTLVSVFLIRYLVGFGVILTACFGLFLILLWRYYDAEYEYELVDGELSIDRIMAKSSRKHCGTYNVARMDIMAPTGSEKVEYRKHQKLKTSDYSSNKGDDGCYVLYLPSNNEMVRIIIQPDERMLAAIKAVAQGKVYDR